MAQRPTWVFDRAGLAGLPKPKVDLILTGAGEVQLGAALSMEALAGGLHDA